MNKFEIVVTGVGGQGILRLAEIIGRAAVIEGKNVRIGEVHGMAQRQGSVICTIRIGEKVHGPLIIEGSADLLVGLELIESLRASVFLSHNGAAVLNKYTLIPRSYQGESLNEKAILTHFEKICKKLFVIDAVNIAKQIGDIRTTNIVLLGKALGNRLLPLKEKSIEKSLEQTFSGKTLEMNLKALKAGLRS